MSIVLPAAYLWLWRSELEKEERAGKTEIRSGRWWWAAGFCSRKGRGRRALGHAATDGADDAAGVPAEIGIGGNGGRGGEEEGEVVVMLGWVLIRQRSQEMCRRMGGTAGVPAEPCVGGDGRGGRGDGEEEGYVMVVLVGCSALEEKEAGEAPAEYRIGGVLAKVGNGGDGEREEGDGEVGAVEAVELKEA